MRNGRCVYYIGVIVYNIMLKADYWHEMEQMIRFDFAYKSIDYMSGSALVLYSTLYLCSHMN